MRYKWFIISVYRQKFQPSLSHENSPRNPVSTQSQSQLFFSHNFSPPAPPQIHALSISSHSKLSIHLFIYRRCPFHLHSYISGPVLTTLYKSENTAFVILVLIALFASLSRLKRLQSAKRSEKGYGDENNLLLALPVNTNPSRKQSFSKTLFKVGSISAALSCLVRVFGGGARALYPNSGWWSSLSSKQRNLKNTGCAF